MSGVTLICPTSSPLQTQTSARRKGTAQHPSVRGKIADLPADPNTEAGAISLSVTHDVMCFPGISEPSEDALPPKMHAATKVSIPAAPGSGATKDPQSPDISGAGKALGSSSPPAGRLSFATAIRRKLRASDTRRTERALEEGPYLSSSSESSSEEEDPPDPPPPPPRVSDWVQAAARE